MQYCDEILIPGSCWTNTRWWTIAIGGSCSLVKNDGRHKDGNETVSLPTVMSFRLRDCEIASSSGSWAWWHDAGITEADANLDLLLTTGGWWWRRRVVFQTKHGGCLWGALKCGVLHLLGNWFKYQWTFFVRKSTWICELIWLHSPLTTDHFLL